MPLDLPFEIPLLGKILSGITVYFIITWLAVVHVLLHKRNSRAAFGWVGLILLFPLAGALLYALFGVNRVRRKARRYSQELGLAEEQWPEVRPPRRGTQLDQPGYHVTGRRLRGNNRVTTYFNGEQAYPAMLESIENARQEVLLSSYIFDNDGTGRRFIDALARARDRGCRVRLLVDDIGLRYSFPSAAGSIRSAGLEFRRFMPLRLIPPSFSINLRTHRKILACDRAVAYAGGMNIGDRQLVEGQSPHKAADLHFRFDGRLAGDLARLFADDWKFAGGEDIDLSDFPAGHPESGEAQCRLISDGPDENLDALLLVLLGGFAAARKRIWIMSPYFLPEDRMLGCLQAAALSGVDVKILIPAKNNWPLVQWALQHSMNGLLKSGVRILRRPPPFAHSKCLIIDDEYAMVGSSNLDPRSLRLNFELGIEIFDRAFNKGLAAHFREVLPECEAFTPELLENRNTLARLRDATAAMFTPYL
jgi:cardiolipin synthase